MYRYLDGVVLGVLSGVLPFGSIFIEMYFVFTSFWAYKIYYVYGFMLLVFGILAIVASCVTIVTVYLQLNMEDYRWYGWFGSSNGLLPWFLSLTPVRKRRCCEIAGIGRAFTSLALPRPMSTSTPSTTLWRAPRTAARGDTRGVIDYGLTGYVYPAGDGLDRMTGFFQIFFYFSYTAVICFGIFVGLGTME